MTTEIKQNRKHEDYPIDYAEIQRESPQRLIVLMPAAQPAPRDPAEKPRFFRWSWESSWPTDMVVSFADPALQASTELGGAWYIHAEYDFIQEIADIVAKIAEEHSIVSEDIIFYGSSLGGFGAISAAACIKGAKAVAEVPQIDFRNWIPGPKAMVEKYLTKEPLESFYEKFPERISVIDRIKVNEIFPHTKILTNPTEYSLADQQDFAAWVNATVNDARVEVIFTDLAQGHAPLNRENVVHLI